MTDTPRNSAPIHSGHRVLAVKKSSIVGTILPMALLVGGVAALVLGLASIWRSDAPVHSLAPGLICFGGLLVVANALNFIIIARRVELDSDGNVTFRYHRRCVSCQLVQVSVVAAFMEAPDSNWPIKFRTPTRWVRVCRQLAGVEELVKA